MAVWGRSASHQRWGWVGEDLNNRCISLVIHHKWQKIITTGVTAILLSLPEHSQRLRRHWRNVLHNMATVIDWQIQHTKAHGEAFRHQHGTDFETKGRQKSHRVRLPRLEQWISDQKPLFSLRYFLLRSVRAIFNTASSVKCYRKGACHISQ